MNKHHSETRKIDPTRGATLGDGSPNDADRIEIGPTQLAFDEWAAAGIELPNLDAMRTFRHKRLTQHLVDRGYAGLLMFDPLNIRYATDSTNMQLWNTHNPFRACLICPDGYMVLWDYKNAPFLSSFNPLVREVRAGADFFYFDRGDQIGAAADVFAADVKDILRQHGGADDRRLAVDKVMLHGLRALEAVGYHIEDGEEVTEKARSVKGPDEIKAMRCSIHACEAVMYAMEDFARTNVGDGKTCEDDIWAILHAENIRRGGNGSKHACCPLVHAQILGFRKVARVFASATKSLPLIPTSSAHTVFAPIYRALGGSAQTRRARTWCMHFNMRTNT